MTILAVLHGYILNVFIGSEVAGEVSRPFVEAG